MAYKFHGAELEAGITTTLVTIPKVKIRSAQTISEGHRNITEIPGETGDTASVVCSNEGIDISITGYLEKGITREEWPKNADECTIAGYTIGYIDGVSINQTPEGPWSFSCTAHGRQKTPSA